MDISRSRHSFAAIAVLPAVLMPLSHAKENNFAFPLVVAFSLMAMAAAVLGKHVFYLRRTPLVRIDETTLTFFGNAHRQRRSFQRSAISEITLSKRPRFWRSAFHFSVLADGETINLWIPYSSEGSVEALARALREQFPNEFAEVVA